jgi:hypothetical protein
MGIRIWVFLVFLLLIPGCKKEIDFRDKYTGSFSFTVESYEWHTGVPVNIVNRPTVIYNGTIILYRKDDYLKDLKSYTSDEEYNDTDQRLTICFSESCIITPVLLKDGAFVSEQIPHYNFAGQFLNYDEVEFTVKDIGSVGLTFNYHVTGMRK